MEDVTDLAPAPVAGSSRSGASDSTKSKKAGSSKAGAKATEAMMMDIDLSDTDLTNNIGIGLCTIKEYAYKGRITVPARWRRLKTDAII